MLKITAANRNSVRIAVLPVRFPSRVKKSGERKIPRLKEELYMDSAVVVCWPEVTWVMVSENRGK